MREYETTVIVQPEISAEGTEAIMNKMDGVLAERGSTRLMCSDLGKRKLAYEVRKFQKGHYYVLSFLDDGKVVNELERSLRLEESVLRFMTVKVEDEVADIEVRKEEARIAEADQEKRAAEKAAREAEEAKARAEVEAQAAAEAEAAAAEPAAEPDAEASEEVSVDSPEEAPVADEAAEETAAEAAEDSADAEEPSKEEAAVEEPSETETETESPTSGDDGEEEKS